jgi:hypothetical protein
MGRPKGSKNKNYYVTENEIVVEGDIVKIILNSPKYGIHFAYVDKDKYHLVKCFRWGVVKPKHVFYAYAKHKNSSIKMHRVVLGLELGKYIVDHSDGNGLNNLVSNLRIATNIQNGQNRKIHEGREYKGVYQADPNQLLFKAYIHVNKKSVYLGQFNNKEQAARAYNEAAIKYFGIFARLNIIPDVNKSGVSE